MEKVPESPRSSQGLPDPVEGCLPEPRSDGLVLEEVAETRSLLGSCVNASNPEPVDSASGTNMAKLTKADLVEVFKASTSAAEHCKVIIHKLGERIKQPLSQDEERLLKTTISKIKSRFNEYWRKSNRN